MSGLKEIKTRITSVKNTQQMTKSMKMVSVARLRSAQIRHVNLRAYAYALERVLKDVVLSQKIQHPFLKQSSSKNFKKVLYVIITSDRGLCGAFNGNTCRFAEKLLNQKKYPQQDLFFIGKKAKDYFKHRGIDSQGVLLNLVKEISYPLAAKISKQLMDKILLNNYQAVFVIYNEFKSVNAPRILCERFLPYDLFSERLSQDNLTTEQAKTLSRNIIFEVSSKELMSSLVEKYFNIQIYRFLCENVSAEHGSRMTAMESATKNAEEVAEALTLKYNKLRQSSITTELTEIVSGSESLK